MVLTEYKRVGSPIILEKDSTFAKLKIQLNGKPDNNWQELFKHPSSSSYNEAHPKYATLTDDYIVFNSLINSISDNTDWMDKYIAEANEKYKAWLQESS